VKYKARYELIAPFAGEAFINVNDTEFIEIDLLDEEVNNLKDLMKANGIGETYLGELGWYLTKAKYLYDTSEQENLIRDSSFQLHVMPFSKKEVSEEEIRKTFKEYDLLKQIFELKYDIEEIRFYPKGKKPISFKTNYLRKTLLEGIFKKFNSSFTFLEDSQSSILNRINLPPILRSLQAKIGKDKQKKNLPKTKALLEQIEFIDNLYCFLDAFQSLKTEYKIENFIAGILFFAGKSMAKIDYYIQQDNPEHQDKIRDIVDNNTTIAKTIKAKKVQERKNNQAL
jgi:hypothetical protein